MSILPFTVQETFSKLTSPFGWRVDPITKERRHHNGVDFAIPRGTPVLSPWAGHIFRVDSDARGHANGNAVWVDHGYVGLPWLRLRSLFLHLDVAEVEMLDQVSPGQRVGRSGNTGRTTGPNGGYHLHYELWATLRTDDKAASQKVPWLPVDPAGIFGWHGKNPEIVAAAAVLDLDMAKVA